MTSFVVAPTAVEMGDAMGSGCGPSDPASMTSTVAGVSRSSAAQASSIDGATTGLNGGEYTDGFSLAP